jgi:hypothetical protein
VFVDSSADRLHHRVVVDVSGSELAALGTVSSGDQLEKKNRFQPNIY